MRSRKKLDLFSQQPAIYHNFLTLPPNPIYVTVFLFWACLCEPSAPKSLAECLARVNQVYTTGPASRSTQWSPLWDEPTQMDRLADPDTYKTINNNPACFNIDVESIAFATADAPGPNGTPHTAFLSKIKFSALFCLFERFPSAPFSAAYTWKTPTMRFSPFFQVI